MTELEKRAARMKWDPPRVGTEERKKMPAHAFLGPGRTYPYKVKIDGEWVISEPALRSVISVANFQGAKAISAKASKLLEELQGEEMKHHGILGMKWGIRRQRGPDGRVIPGTIEKTAGAAGRAIGRGVKTASPHILRAGRIATGKVLNATGGAIVAVGTLGVAGAVAKKDVELGKKAVPALLLGVGVYTVGELISPGSTKKKK